MQAKLDKDGSSVDTHLNAADHTTALWRVLHPLEEVKRTTPNSAHPERASYVIENPMRARLSPVTVICVTVISKSSQNLTKSCTHMNTCIRKTCFRHPPRPDVTETLDPAVRLTPLLHDL
eukprot:9250973-Pyramimonas_sp.AAC.1